MLFLVLLATTVVALWLAELIGSVQLRGWGGALLTAAICRIADTGIVALLNLAGSSTARWISPAAQSGPAGLALEFGWAALLLLLSGSVVPGFRVRGFMGLVLVTGLVVGSKYATIAILARAFGSFQ